MLFVRLGQIAAWLTLALGAIRTGMGVFVAIQDDAQVRAAMTARYFSRASSGEAIDQGVWMMGFAIILGILAHIARSVDRR